MKTFIRILLLYRDDVKTKGRRYERIIIANILYFMRVIIGNNLLYRI